MKKRIFCERCGPLFTSKSPRPWAIAPQVPKNGHWLGHVVFCVWVMGVCGAKAFSKQIVRDLSWLDRLFLQLLVGGSFIWLRLDSVEGFCQRLFHQKLVGCYSIKNNRYQNIYIKKPWVSLFTSELNRHHIIKNKQTCSRLTRSSFSFFWPWNNFLALWYLISRSFSYLVCINFMLSRRILPSSSFSTLIFSACSSMMESFCSKMSFSELFSFLCSSLICFCNRWKELSLFCSSFFTCSWSFRYWASQAWFTLMS